MHIRGQPPDIWSLPAKEGTGYLKIVAIRRTLAIATSYALMPVSLDPSTVLIDEIGICIVVVTPHFKDEESKTEFK